MAKFTEVFKNTWVNPDQVAFVNIYNDGHGPQTRIWFSRQEADSITISTCLEEVMIALANKAHYHPHKNFS